MGKDKLVDSLKLISKVCDSLKIKSITRHPGSQNRIRQSNNLRTGVTKRSAEAHVIILCLCLRVWYPKVVSLKSKRFPVARAITLSSFSVEAEWEAQPTAGAADEALKVASTTSGLKGVVFTSILISVELTSSPLPWIEWYKLSLRQSVETWRKRIACIWL